MSPSDGCRFSRYSHVKSNACLVCARPRNDESFKSRDMTGLREASTAHLVPREGAPAAATLFGGGAVLGMRVRLRRVRHGTVRFWRPAIRVRRCTLAVRAAAIDPQRE